MQFFNSLENDDGKFNYNLFESWQQNLLQQWNEKLIQTNLFDINSTEIICVLLYNVVTTVVKMDVTENLNHENLSNFIRRILENSYEDYEKLGWKFLLNINMNLNEKCEENVKTSSNCDNSQNSEYLKFVNELDILGDLIKNE